MNPAEIDHRSISTATVGSVFCRSEQQDSTMDAVADSLGSDRTAAGGDSDACELVEPEIDFDLHDLYYLIVQYVPLKGEPHVLYQKYLKKPKPKSEQHPRAHHGLPIEKLYTTIDMKIYRSSNRELVGSLSKSVELPGVLPNLRLPGLVRSIETAGASRVFSLSNIMNERLVHEANAQVAGIPGFHSIFFGIHQVHPGGRFELVSRRVQPISNSEVFDLFAQGVISSDHRTESWPEGNRLHLQFLAPTIGKRRESLGSGYY